MNNWKKCKSFLLLCFILPYTMIGQMEICDNGIDDDNDSQIDLNDEDCICEVVTPLSLIPNPSFEEINCCPDNYNQLDCATDWIQASEPTTDFFHTCGFLGANIFPAPQPFPDGEGIMGFRDGRVNGTTPDPYWKEYAGACLINPLLKDSTYRIQFDVGFVDSQKSPPIDISFFGTPSCDFLPFGIGDVRFGCPSNSPNWIKLGEVRVSGGAENTWVNTSIDITTTQDIYAIAIGPACDPVTTDNDIYYFLDNLLLADLASFELQVSPSTHPCQSDFSLSVPFNPDFEYQWYLEGVALINEVFPEIPPIYGEGNYQVRILKDANCRVSAAYNYFVPTYNTTATTLICSGNSHELVDMPVTSSGFYIDSLKAHDNCDSIVLLKLEVIDVEYDTVEASIFEGEIFEYKGNRFTTPGEYILALASSLGCDKFISIRLTTFNVFIPNVFSPNGDGVNDTFSPHADSGKIETVNMKIFDRWGKLVYEGAEWNGSDFNSGVFVYLINVEFTHGTSESFSGSITLMK